MKGYATKLKEGFKLGLRPTDDTYRNAGVLISGMNCRAGKAFLAGYSPDITAFPKIYDASTGAEISMALQWPFPQVFQHDTGIYVGNRTGLYLVEYDATYGLKGTNLCATYTSGIRWPWTMADVPGFPFFSSGNVLVYYDPDLADWTWIDSTLAGTAGSCWDSTFYPPIAVCHNRGQIFAGGAITHSTYPSQSRIVRWSQIGAAKWLTVPTTHDEMQDAVKNTAGFLYENADDYGQIQRILPLGKATIVYGSESVFGLMPVAEPVPVFSVIPLHNRGIRNPLAAAASRDTNLFVDSDDRLYTITNEGSQTVMVRELTPKELGFDEFFGPLQDDLSITDGTGIISVVYNPVQKEWIISNGFYSYLYNGVGLTPIDISVTSLVNYKNTPYATGFGYSALSGGLYGFIKQKVSGFSMQTDSIDLGLSGIKTIESIYLSMDMGANSTVEVMVEWRNNKSMPFRQTTWRRVSPGGMAFPVVAGVEFRLNIRSDKYHDLEISEILVNFKITDKTGIRGIYNVSDNASGAGG